jgi:ribose 5-phosphate isomerase B
MEILRVAFASDHGGFTLKSNLIASIEQISAYKIIDLGVTGIDSIDYPDIALKLIKLFKAEGCDRGVLICGTGIGMSIFANRFGFIRAAVCHDEFTARLSRLHNDSNILVLGERVLGVDLAQSMLKLWLSTPFEGGRHERRLNKIKKLVGGSDV